MADGNIGTLAHKNILKGCWASMLLWSLTVSAVFGAVITSSTDQRGAVACESKTCSEIGIELLERGVSFLVV